MSIDSLVSRLRKVNDELMTISSFRKIQEMSERRGKICKCPHHRSNSASRSPGRKCCTNPRDKKKSSCSCHQRPKSCLCTRQKYDKNATDHKSTSPELDEQPARQSVKSLRRKESERISYQESFRKIDASESPSPRENSKQVHRDKSKDSSRDLSKNSALIEKSSSRDKTEKTTKTDSAKEDESSSGRISGQRKNSTEKSYSDESRTEAMEIAEEPKPLERKESLVRLYDRVTSEEVIRNESAVHGKSVEALRDRELTKRNLELEERLKNMDCNMNCLRSESQKQAASLMDALEKSKTAAGLASRSRDLAMDLAKQSRDQTESIKASRDEIADRMNLVDRSNAELRCECQKLRCKLDEIENSEKRRYAETEEKINRVQSATKEKEMALTSEVSKLEKTICELTNQAKGQKKRISDLTLICANQRDLISENENCISMKIAELAEAHDQLQSTACKCTQMQEQINHLQCRLHEQEILRDNLQKELDKGQDNCDCELRIKNKIIEDQNETIKKLKKLLQDSEKMAHQAACEFESLRDELHCLKQSNKSLRMALEELEERTNDENDDYCERCNILEEKMREAAEQRQRALAAAKCAAAKLCSAGAEYERQIDSERRRNECANSLIERQNVEIRLLKKEILCVKEYRSRRSNDRIDRQ